MKPTEQQQELDPKTNKPSTLDILSINIMNRINEKGQPCIKSVFVYQNILWSNRRIFSLSRKPL